MPNRLFWTQINRAFSIEGEPVPGARAYFYRNLSSDQAPVYQDPECTQEFSQPVIADSEGTFPPIYRTEFGPVRVRMTDEDGITLPGYPIDDIVPLSADASVASSVGFAPTEAVPTTNVQAAIERISQAISNQDPIQNRALTPWTTSGTGNDYIISPSPAIIAYGDWQYFVVRFNRTNTGASTLNVNGRGSRPILRVSSTGAFVPVKAGEIPASLTASLYYDGSRFIIVHGGPLENSPLATRIQTGADYVAFTPAGTVEIARVAANALVVGAQSTIDPSVSGMVGFSASAIGAVKISRSNAVPLEVKRELTGGVMLNWWLGVTNVASVTADTNGIVAYNTFCGGHWSQGPELPPGTIVETIDELAEWDDDEYPMLPKYRAAREGARGVYGVWSHLDDDGDPVIAGLGAYKVRIAPGTTVKLHDLITCGGDGLGVPQADDVIRSSTVGKVTSTAVLETLPDGSFLVPCVLYCG